MRFSNASSLCPRLVIGASLTTPFVALPLGVTLSTDWGVVAAMAQAAPKPDDRVKLDLSRGEVAVIAEAIMELPYKKAVPILQTLQAQVNAQTPPAASPAPPPPMMGPPSAATEGRAPTGGDDKR
jgi:hypothetical protein